jgi:hypothetical protein
MLKYLLSGFLINFFTSIDDALTNIPVLSAVTRTRAGRIAFSIGNVLAVTFTLFLSVLLSRFLETLPYVRIVVPIFLLVIAWTLYFDVLKLRPPRSVALRLQHPEKMHRLRFVKLVGLGFFMTFITIIDDVFALSPLFIDGLGNALAAVVGIYLAAFSLIIITIRSAAKLAAIPHKKEIAVGVILIFALLFALGVV